MKRFLLRLISESFLFLHSCRLLLLYDHTHPPVQANFAFQKMHLQLTHRLLLPPHRPYPFYQQSTIPTSVMCCTHSFIPNVADNDKIHIFKVKMSNFLSFRPSRLTIWSLMDNWNTFVQQEMQKLKIKMAAILTFDMPSIPIWIIFFWSSKFGIVSIINMGFARTFTFYVA